MTKDISTPAAAPTEKLSRPAGEVPEGMLQTPDGALVVRTKSQQITDSVLYPSGLSPAAALQEKGRELEAKGRAKLERARYLKAVSRSKSEPQPDERTTARRSWKRKRNGRREALT